MALMLDIDPAPYHPAPTAPRCRALWVLAAGPDVGEAGVRGTFHAHHAVQVTLALDGWFELESAEDRVSAVRVVCPISRTTREEGHAEYEESRLVCEAHDKCQGDIQSRDVAIVKAADLPTNAGAPNCDRLVRERVRRPFLVLGSTATRKSSASSPSEVIWQTTTDACPAGSASVCTITAGRG